MAEATETVEETDETTETTEETEEWTPPTREEWEAQQNEANRLKRERADAAKRAKDAERAAKAAAQRKAEEEGDWKRIAQEKEADAEQARKDAEEATGKLAKYERQRAVSTAASALNFRDAQDAVIYLTNPDSPYFLEPEKFNDDKLVEAALRRLKKDKPGLLAEPRRSGRDGYEAPGDAGLTAEQKHARWLASKF